MGLAPKRIDHLSLMSVKCIIAKLLSAYYCYCFLGILYNHGWGTGMPMAFDEIRYASVLGRIAIAWFFCAMLVWHTSLRTQVITAVSILLGYWLLLCFVPVPGGSAGDLSAAGSWNAWFDKYLLPGISYQNRVVDPEGVLSNIPAIVNALMGVFAGQLLLEHNKLANGKCLVVIYFRHC